VALVAAWSLRPSPSAEIARGAGRLSLAVIPPQVEPGQEWLSTALGEQLAADLSAGGDLRVAAADSVQHALFGQALLAPEPQDAEVERLRARMGIAALARGSATFHDGRIALRLHLHGAAGRALASFAGESADGELSELAGRAAAELRRALRLRQPGLEELQAAAAELPHKAAAIRGFGEGLRRMRLFDFVGAVESLKAAAAQEPEHPLLHAALSDAYDALGGSREAGKEAQLAFAAAAGTSRATRLSLEALTRERNGKSGQAIELRRALFTFFPDDVEHGLRLAHTQTQARKPADALATLAALRKLPAPASDDPRISLEEEGAASASSDHGKRLQAARRALAQARAQSLPSLEVSARLAESAALFGLGQSREALDGVGLARAAFERMGHRLGVCKALVAEGLYLMNLDKLEQADQTLRKALDVARKEGFAYLENRALGHLAITAARRADFALARDWNRQALEAEKKVDDPVIHFNTVGRLGGLAMLTGEVAQAERWYAECLEGERKGPHRQGLVHALLNLAELKVERDQLDEAEKLTREALAIAEEKGYFLAAPARGVLGVIAMERGRPADAVPLLEKAVAGLEKSKPALTAEALADLALAEARLGRTGPALTHAAEALRRAAANEDLRDSMEPQLNAAYAWALADRKAGVARGLELAPRIQEAAHKIGAVQKELFAGLRLGQIELLAGRAKAARARLSSVAGQAAARGYARVAAEAKRTLRGQ
jgi:hypothetical protein